MRTGVWSVGKVSLSLTIYMCCFLVAVWFKWVRNMIRIGGRKRQIDNESQSNLEECLLESGVTDAKAVKIWNKARKGLGKEEVSKEAVKRVQKERLQPAESCFVIHKMETDTKEWSSILLPRIHMLLQLMVDTCPAWAQALCQVAKDFHGLLHPVLYHDEVVAGNVLAVVKVKKVTAVYLSFQEFWPVFHTEGAWLPIMCVQHIQCDAIHGGLSAVMRALIRHIHIDTYHRGFLLCINGNQHEFRLAKQSHFIADHDAQRGTWSTKGSSGLKPCQFCANICSKNAIPATDGFYTIASWEWDRFAPIPDADWRAAYNHLSSLTTKAERDMWEKAYGVNFCSFGLLADPIAFRALPISHACNDVMHGYYSNGIASVEIAAVLHSVKAVGLTIEALLEVALDSNWHSAQSKRPQPCLLKRLFASKQVGEHVYKGQAKETQMLVFLLAYYLHRFLSGCDTVSLELKSFLALQKCASHLRALGFCHVPLREACQVQTLHRAQLLHQQLYVEAYGQESVIPKHHHRLHVPESCLKLGALPTVQTHESKHRILKSGGILDAQRARLTDSGSLQKAVLPRLVLDTVHQINQHGFGRWDLLPPIHSAAGADGTIVQADAMQLRNVIIRAGHPAFGLNQTWIVDACLRGNTKDIQLVCRPLATIQKQPWGTVHTNAGGPTRVWQPSPQDGWMSPVFWRYESLNQTFICIW